MNKETALLIVDVQNDFMPGGPLAVPKGDKVIAPINEIQKSFDFIVATQDWHPQNHSSFAANHAGKKVGDQITIEGLEQILWPVHCVQNTQGSQIVNGLDTGKIKKYVYKGTRVNIDSYSAFFDNGKKNKTELQEYLSSHGIKNVYVVGLATDYCIKYTAIDAAELGFNTFLYKNAIEAINIQPQDGERSLEEMKAKGVQII